MPRESTLREVIHLHARERPIALDWEVLDENHGALYYRNPEGTEEDLARLAAAGSRRIVQREDPIKLLWDLE